MSAPRNVLLAGLAAALAACASAPRERRFPVTVARYEDPALAALEAARREARGEDLRDALIGTTEAEFAVTGTRQRATPHGLFETWVSLRALGRGRVSRIAVRAMTSGVRVHDVTLEGPGVDVLVSNLRISRDGTDFREIFRMVPAVDMDVRVTTEGDPGPIRVEISPLSEKLEI